jgi:D-alanyl-D-alanine carboxypeptidase (penicillin-binding protein 5/6)
MNDMGRKLGLTQSHFDNATGLPDDAHLMSARDLAALAHHIIHDFPEYYHYFSQKEFEHHGIKQGNRNLLLYEDSSVDGLKTGHTDAGGFGMVASSKDKDGRRIIVVVNGLGNEKERAEETKRLLAYGFRDFDNVTLLHKGDVLEKADVWFGADAQVPLTVEKDLVLTLPKTRRDALKFTLDYDGPLPAPVHAGDHVADLTIESPDAPTQKVPLVAAESVEKQHGFSHMMHVLKYYASGQ